MSAFTCGHPSHEGDRLVRHPYDQYVKKITYRRVDGAIRKHEREVMRLCRDCVELDAGAADQPSLMLDGGS